MCRTKKAAVEQLKAETDDQFLGTLDVGTSVTNTWEVTLLLNGLPVLFKINTGADVSAISQMTFKQLQGASLISPNHCLSGQGQDYLHVFGQFTATLTDGAKETQEVIFIVKNLQKSLLGRPGIEALDLVPRINTLQGEEKFLLCIQSFSKAWALCQGSIT